jgi:hypothetical protein
MAIHRIADDQALCLHGATTAETSFRMHLGWLWSLSIEVGTILPFI